MPHVVEEAPYNGVNEKLDRLGLRPLYEEVKRIVTGFSLLVKEKKDANGGAAVRKMIDEQFASSTGWIKHTSGDIDWIKSKIVNGTKVTIGVEVQFSARSDLMIIDVAHLRRAISNGLIDVGVLVAPSNRLAVFLTDRGPSIAVAKRHVHEARAEDQPLMLMALEHDGAGPPLAKQAKRTHKGRPS